MNPLQKIVSGAIIIASLAGLSCGGREKEKEYSYSTQEYGIKVSERIDDLGDYGIGYCGMINEKTFSLRGGTSWSTNYYYPVDSKEINFEGRRYEVVSVNPEEIVLRQK